jgi:4-amino-4-deoxy-L-arabinose transferase-like glycosyltransferase
MFRIGQELAMTQVMHTPARTEIRAGLDVRRVARLLASSAAPVLALLVVAVLGAYHLEMYPRTWFDEGLNLLAARTLADSGRFGLETVDGFSAFDLGLGTGPTVIVPIALIFKAFGVSLGHARVVPLTYLLLAATGLFCVARQTFGRTVGIVAVLTFASLSTTGPLVFGREVLGDVPALAFIFWGVAALAGRRVHQDRWWLAAGLLFGLAVLTKHQMAIFVPAILASGLLARFGDRHFSLRRWLLLLVAIVIPIGLWFGYELATMGLPWFVQHIYELNGEASAVLKISPLRRAPGALAELVNSGFTVWGAAGLLYIWLLALRDDWRSQPDRLILPSFATIWLGWFLFFSIGWPRYAMPAVAICSLFSAKLLCDLARGSTPFAEPRAFNVLRLRAAVNNPLGTALLVLLASSVLSGLASNGFALLRAKDTSPQEFAALVSQIVEPGAVVESSEWEIDFLTNGQYHHPPANVIIESVGTVFLEKQSLLVAQYQVPATATYLINGPFSRLTGMYSQEGEAKLPGFKTVATAGEYELLLREK